MIFFTFGSKRFTFGFTKPIIKLTKSNLMRIKTNQHIYQNKMYGFKRKQNLKLFQKPVIS